MHYKSYREAFFSDRAHSSDKWEHYFDIYDHLLGEFYGTDVHYLEIGVQDGGSLETAAKLFAKGAAIMGLDIDPGCARLEKEGLASRIFIGSQVDDQVLQSVLNYSPTLDVIIDDGSHVQAHMILTFIKLFPAVSQGGVYIIEDTHTNYSPEHQESFFGIGLYDYFKGLSERLNLDYLEEALRRDRYKMPRDQRPPRAILPDICRDIFSIEFFDSVIAVRKKKKLEPLRIRK